MMSRQMSNSSGMKYSLSNRLAFADAYDKIRQESGGSNQTTTCITGVGGRDFKNGSISDYVHLKKPLGGESSNAEAFVACVGTKQECLDGGGIPAAVKLMPLRPDRNAKLSADDQRVLSNRHSPEALQHEVWVEITAMELCKILLQQRICPNLPLMYGYDYCNNCSYTNPNLKGDSKKCLLMVNELFSGGDYRTWIRASKRTTQEFRSSMFQLGAGLHTMWNKMGISHRDFHAGNVLFHGNSKPRSVRLLGYLRYKMNGRFFHCPVYGDVDPDLFIIWDFQYAFRENIFDSVQTQEERHEQEQHPLAQDIGPPTYDYERFTSLFLGSPKPSKADHDPLARYASPGIIDVCERFRKYAEQNLRIDQVMEIEFQDYLNVPRDAPILETYDMDTRVVVPPALCGLGIFLPETTTSAKCEGEVDINKEPYLAEIAIGDNTKRSGSQSRSQLGSRSRSRSRTLSFSGRGSGSFSLNRSQMSRTYDGM